MKKIKQGKRLAAAGLSGIMALSIGLPNFPVTTKAAYARGDAPFINTWLVAG